MLTVRLVRWQRRIHTELVKGESGGALAVIPLAVIGTGASAYVAVPSISNAQRLCYQRGKSVHSSGRIGADCAVLRRSPF